eukprot:scaffold129058_cov67-Cyclotella_meneghiniana.AAC.4
MSAVGNITIREIPLSSARAHPERTPVSGLIQAFTSAQPSQNLTIRVTSGDSNFGSRLLPVLTILGHSWHPIYYNET